MESEPALVAKAVEHPGAFGEGRDGRVVVDLVEVDARFLTLQQIDGLSHSEHFDFEGTRRGAMQHTRDRLQPLGLANRRVVSLDDRFRLKNSVQSFDNQFFSLIHGHCQRLKDEMRAVAIDHQSGQTVGLAPDQAVNGLGESHRLPQRERPFDSALEKVRVQILFSPRETAGHDLRVRIVDRRTERPVFNVLELDDRARLWIAQHTLHFGRVDPFVTMKEAGAGLDDERGHVDDR